ncbi:hypothetical protein K461DRAFT_1361 [Myriangium duriaei CBS 260.36]|uniref:Uncharacterized protein n=1 Tax=Myriangium duriaei CBS 260.36 TaxID=1168546 RepID=A0A9P4JBJ2_9PEZI|nr:hypothetical protein K461DRAFT_1361 [Myriangium duriaei CBS 260.36]
MNKPSSPFLSSLMHWETLGSQQKHMYSQPSPFVRGRQLYSDNSSRGSIAQLSYSIHVPCPCPSSHAPAPTHPPRRSILPDAAPLARSTGRDRTIPHPPGGLHERCNPYRPNRRGPTLASGRGSKLQQRGHSPNPTPLPPSRPNGCHLDPRKDWTGLSSEDDLQ